MRSWLSAKVPSFHDTLITLTFANRLNINKLSNMEMLWTKEVADWQQILWRHPKLSQMFLWRQPIFKIVTSLWLLHSFGKLFSTADLYGVNNVPVELLLNLDDLTSVYLDNSAWHLCAPSIPEVSHAHFVTKETCSFTIHINRLSRNKIKLCVKQICSASERIVVVSDAKISWEYCSVIDDFSL